MGYYILCVDIERPQHVVGAAGGNFRAGGHTIACMPKDLPLAAKLEPLCRRMHLPSLPMDTVGPPPRKKAKIYFRENKIIRLFFWILLDNVSDYGNIDYMRVT